MANETESHGRTPIDVGTRGILHPGVALRKIRLERIAPAPDLAHLIERYWIVRWNLAPGERHVQETLPYPCVNVTVQRGASGVFGPVTGKFAAHLEGQGVVVGTKFRPGAFFAMLGAPVSTIANRSLTLRELFGEEDARLEESVLRHETDSLMTAEIEAFWRRHLPLRDERVEEIGRIIDHVIADRSVTRVDDLVDRFGLSKRSLQRLFSRYVGVGPKWVIGRYRLQEAAELIACGRASDWTATALDLGYFDQAHFIRDFRTIIGTTPAEYARRARTLPDERPER